MDAPWIENAEKFGSRGDNNDELKVCDYCNIPFNANSSGACRDSEHNLFCCHDCFDDFHGYRRVV